MIAFLIKKHFQWVKKNVYILWIEFNFTGFPYKLTLYWFIVHSLLVVKSVRATTHPTHTQTPKLIYTHMQGHSHSNIYLHTFTYLYTYTITYVLIQFQLHTHNHECTHWTHENSLLNIQILININTHTNSQLHWFMKVQSLCMYINDMIVQSRIAVSLNFWMPPNRSLPTLPSPSNPATVTKTIFPIMHST